jgi:hypothetical protein
MNPYIAWAKQYFEHKDIFKQEIDSIEELEETLTITKKNGIQEVVILYAKFKGKCEKKTWVVAQNTTQAVDTVISEWSTLSQEEKIRLIFIDLTTNKFWLLHPYTHARIADDSKLKEGLRALQENA